MSKKFKSSLTSEDFDFKSFSEKIEFTLINDSQAIISTWKDSSEQILRNFINQIELFQQACTIENERIDKQCDPLSRFNQFNEMLNNCSTPPQVMLQPEQFRQVWDGAQKLIIKLPASSREVIDPEIQKKSGNKNLHQITGRIIARSWLQYRLAKDNIYLGIKKIQKKQTGEKSWNKRDISVERFVRFFILLPIQKEILGIWNSYNCQLSNQFHDLQDSFIWATSFEYKSPQETDNKHLSTVLNAMQDKIDVWDKEVRTQIVSFIWNQIILARRNWLIAATPLCSEKKYNLQNLNKSIRDYGKLFSHNRNSWQTHWAGELKDWQKQIDLSRICWIAFLSRQDLTISISQTLDEKILQRLQHIISVLSANRDKFNSTEYKDITKLLSSTIHNRAEIDKSLLNTYIPNTIDALLDIELGKNIEGYKKVLNEELSSLDDEYVIFKKQDSDKLIPESILETIPLKELLTMRIENLFMQLEDMQIQINDTLLNISDDLSSLIEIIIYMGETAQEISENTSDIDLEELSQKVNVTLTDGYQRAIDLTERVVEKLNELKNNIFQATNTFVSQFYEITTELRENEKLINLKLELVGSRTRKKFSNLKKIIIVHYRKLSRILFRKIIHRMSKASDSINTGYRRISEIARLRSVDLENTRAISEYLKKTKDNLDKLPTVYRRLFRFTPLEDAKLYVKRVKEQEKLEEAYVSWKKGNTGLVAIVGERGSGRTSFINENLHNLFANTRMNNIKPEQDINSGQDLFEFLKKSFDLPQVNSLEDLEQIINDNESRSICVLENLHHIFLKTIDGLEIIKRLVLFMMRTDRSVFWVTTCSYYTWIFLEKVIGISTLFGSTIELEDLTNAELAELILKRHKLSGLPYLFTPSESLKNSPKYRKLKNQKEQQNWLKERFFTILEEFSSGNISVAMLYWQNCIKIVDNNRIIAATGNPVDLRFLQNLSTEDLFAIVVLIQHETINITEFSHVLHLTNDEARLILTSLNNRGIVIEKNGKFELHFFLYRPMTRILYEKRLLH